MRQGNHNQIGQYAVIADDVTLGDHVIIGNHVTIYPQVSIEDNCRVMDGAVIGRLTHPTVSVSRAAPKTYQPLVIGAGSVIGSHVVLYTGVTLGHEVLLADGVSIREDCVLEDRVFLGRYVMVNYNTRIGTRTRIIDMAYINGNTYVGQDCFLSMQVCTANDNDVYLRRFGLYEGEDEQKGPSLGHYVAVGQNALINPGVRIGDGSLVGTGAVVTRDLPPWSVAMGVPARRVRGIDDVSRQKILALAASRGQQLETD